MLKDLKINKFIDKYLWVIILILSIPAVRYLFIHGFFGVSDDLHIGWLYEMDRSLKSLQFPPRYVPDLSFGFGYPLFTFVYPLPFYIAEFFNLIGFSLVTSVKIVFGLSIPFSIYFFYKLFKKFTSSGLSLAAAVLYVYTPYRAVELFVRGSVGEIVAFVFFPIIILSILEGKTIILALSTAALITSHNILSFMFFPFALLLIFLYKKNIWKNLKGILLGLLGSIYFWLPAIYESKLFKYDTVFNFYDHFPTLKQLITPYFGYGASVPGPYDTMSFYLGVVGIVVVIFGSIFFVKNFKRQNNQEKVFFFWGTFVLLVSLFMMNYRSSFVWENIPLLPYFQFPWRFLSMVLLVIPIFLIGFSKSKYKSIVSLAVIIFTVGLNFNYFKYSEFLGRGDSYYLNRYIPTGDASDAYRQTSEEYLRLPINNEKRPEKIYSRAYTDYAADLKVKETSPLDAQILTDSKVDFVLNYNKYYYPGWYAKIDGKKVEIKIGKPFGQITVDVPKGKHLVEIGYQESKFRLLFDIISLLTLGYCIVMLKKKDK